MRCIALLALLLTAWAAGAAPDTLLFCRGGRVWLLPADKTQPRIAIAEDPGWVYVQPTWIDAERFVTMRLKGGETLRSHVGIVEQTSQLPVKPADLTWLKSAGAALGIGASPAERMMAFTKIGRRGEEQFDLYLTLGALESEWGPSRKIASHEMGDVGGPRARLRFSPDGKQIVVPTFPTDVSATVELYDLRSQKMLSPLWLDWQWMSEHKADGAVSCVGWLADGRLALGTLTTGLYLFDPAKKTIRGVDTWEMGKGGVSDLSVSADGQRVYYSVELYGDGGESASEIRLLGQDGRTSTILKDASSPDAMPAAG
ncbi:MAG: hypothetical protein HZB16_11795 [Armatimonadetes bacterium]|nr:hypothetical protein [Armatimonadota bacterium]